VRRGPVDPDYPTLPGPVQLINTALFNVGKLHVTGIDANVQYAFPRIGWGQFKLSLQGTYIIGYMQQQPTGGYANLVNHENSLPLGAVPYWHHYFTLDWNYGPWSATVTQNYQMGTYDLSPNPGETQLRKIGDYDVWGVSASYSGFRNWQLSAGIKNLMDRDPPFSNQFRTANQGGPAGYDPTYTDPRGRAFWAAIKYSFR
jgi:iron complex outermembrane receptor protein